MAFADNTFVANAAAPATGVLVANIMDHPLGALAYEAGTAGPVTVDGHLARAGNGKTGLSYLRLQSNQAASLAAKAAAPTFAPGDGDCGVLTTAQVLAANLVNLPSNFGVGNGNWTARNAMNVAVHVTSRTAGAAGTDVGSVVLFDKTVTNGDLVLTFRNMCAAASSMLEIELVYRHSIEG